MGIGDGSWARKKKKNQDMTLIRFQGSRLISTDELEFFTLTANKLKCCAKKLRVLAPSPHGWHFSRVPEMFWWALIDHSPIRQMFCKVTGDNPTKSESILGPWTIFGRIHAKATEFFATKNWDIFDLTLV